MDSPLRSNGSPTRQALPTQSIRSPGRSKVAGRIDRVVSTAIGGERAAVLNVSVADLLAEPAVVSRVISAALHRPGVGVMGHWMLQELLRRSRLYDDLVNSLGSPDPYVRAAAARVCAAARLNESLLWITDMLKDEDPGVRDCAVRALSELGGSRAVDALLAAGDSIPLYRLAIALSKATSDMDIELLMRQPKSERTALATVLAAGLKRDTLRVSPLLGIAHDRRWPKQVRVAAAKALAMIADRSAADALGRLAETEPDPAVKRAADRAHRRLVKRAIPGRPR